MSKDLITKAGDFGAIIAIIENAKGRALKAVNAELIHMYNIYIRSTKGNGYFTASIYGLTI